MVENWVGALVCSYRLMSIPSGAAIKASYSAQYYNLERLSHYPAPMLELGLFCVVPDVRDPDVLWIAWGMLVAIVDARSVGLLFVCSSFVCKGAAIYGQAFDLLTQRHQAPDQWHPDVKAPQVVEFRKNAQAVTDREMLGHSAAMAQVPMLLTTFLAMGG